MSKNHYLLTLITISLITPILFLSNLKPVQGQSETTCVGEVQDYIPPENLASMAYQGFLEKQGIPGFQTLEMEFQNGDITGEKVVQAAVAGCLLSGDYEISGHSDYIQEVQNQLELLVRQSQQR